MSHSNGTHMSTYEKRIQSLQGILTYEKRLRSLHDILLVDEDILKNANCLKINLSEKFVRPSHKIAA